MFGTFDVFLLSVGQDKISVIKSIRSILERDLKIAKEMVDNVPSLLIEGLTAEEAKDVKKRIEHAGGTVEIRETGIKQREILTNLKGLPSSQVLGIFKRWAGHRIIYTSRDSLVFKNGEMSDTAKVFAIQKILAD